MSWRNIRLNILPIFIDYMLDGGVPELPPELPAPRGYSAEEVEEFIKNTMEMLNLSLDRSTANLLDAYLIRSDEDFYNIREQLTDEVDYLLPIQVGHEYRAGWRDVAPVTVRLGEFGKPIICVSLSVWGFDTALQPVSTLRAAGREAYFAVDVDDLNRLLRILRVKKALSKTKIVAFGPIPQVNIGTNTVLSNTIYDPAVLKKKFGLELEYWPHQRMHSVVESIPVSKAEEVADRWIKDATEVRHLYREGEVDRKYIIMQARLYLALKKLVEEKGVDAFAGCEPDPFVFPAPSPACFTYIKLKDEGVPCICEADLNAGIAMIMLMYISGKPADMGNLLIPTGKPDMEDFRVPNPDENTIIITHSVTPLRPDGFDTPPNPYIICGTHCDTCWSFNTYTELRSGQEVTIARLSWQGDKLLISEGKIICSRLTPAQGNRECVYIEVPDRMKLFHMLADYGNHLTYVYGNYSKELGELCKILGIKPEYI